MWFYSAISLESNLNVAKFSCNFGVPQKLSGRPERVITNFFEMPNYFEKIGTNFSYSRKQKKKSREE